MDRSMIAKVSVIIPVYNTEAYVEKAILSVVSQSYRNIEIIVVDDASTDSSCTIVEKMAEIDKRIKLLHHEKNKGLSASRNTGSNYSEGKYIYFLDSDDYIAPDCIRICVEEMEKLNLDILTFDATTECIGKIPENFVKVDYDRSNVVEPYRVFSGREFVERYLGTKGVMSPTWLLFLRKQFLDEKGITFLEGAHYEDNKFYFDCMLHSRRVCYIPRSFYTRIYRPGSIMTSELSRNKVNSVFDISIGMINTLLDYDDFSDLFWLQYLERQTFYIIFHILRYFEKVDRTLAEECYELFMLRLSEFYMQLFKVLVKYRIIVESKEYLFCYSMLYEIVDRFGNGYDLTQVGTTLEQIRDYQYYAIYHILSEIGLLSDCGKTIGIYGIGKYAEYVINSYLRVGGMINARLFFIKTDCISYEKQFKGRPVVCIKEASKEEPDAIIVMSTKYDSEMTVAAKRNVKVPVYSIYSILGSSFISHWDNEYTEWVERICNLVIECSKPARIIIVNTPSHKNVGDYMIIRNMERLIQQKYLNYEIIKFTHDEIIRNKQMVFKQIRKQDIVLLGGGGYLGSLWNSGRVVPSIVKECRNNKIIVFPQSIYFPDNETKSEWINNYSDAITHHNNIVICTRDKYSYEMANSLWGEYAKIALFPDVVLMQSDQSRDFSRQGVLICLRTDIESNMTEETRKRIIEKMNTSFAVVRNTSMHYEKIIFEGEIDGVIENKLDEIRRAEVVITDTLHCMISCAITGTPCIALDNCYKKVRGVFEWIKDIPYIKFFDNVEMFFNFEIKDWNEIYKKWKYENHFEKEAEQLLKLIDS
ncbi:glycosyltransferase [Butyrivibrio sp. FC2001]|uniref:glycosyltransferase n=1 Tax=Butyrivibrio sp. FC2001 TaxID=1280671 RepID=UPI0004118400|nr:glycosyltransferase [Butyrivibrio sp. FC2001]